MISVHYPLPELETSRSIGHRDRSAGAYVANSEISVHYPLPELETSRSIGHRDRSAHFVRTMKVNLVKGFPASSRRLSGGYRAYRLYTFIGFIGF